MIMVYLALVFVQNVSFPLRNRLSFDAAPLVSSSSLT